MTASLSGGETVTVASTPGAADIPTVGARPAALVALGLTAVATVSIDLVTKQWALTSLGDGSVVRVLGGAVYLDLTRNSGAAFSIGSQFTVIFPVITLVVLAGIAWLTRRLRSLPWALAMGLIVGGALGNLVDRLFRAPGPLRGHVVDFVSVFAPSGEVFPIFNAADSALFCGVLTAIVLEFTGRRRDGTREHGHGGARARTETAGSMDVNGVDSRQDGPIRPESPESDPASRRQDARRANA